MRNMKLMKVPYHSGLAVTKYDKLGGIMSFNPNLIQIAVANYSVIVRIDDLTFIQDQDYLQTTNQFMRVRSYVDTGFDLYSSQNEYNDFGEIEGRLNKRIRTNNRGDLYFKTR